MFLDLSVVSIRHILSHNVFGGVGLDEAIEGVAAIDNEDYILIDTDWVLANRRYRRRHEERKIITNIRFSISRSKPQRNRLREDATGNAEGLSTGCLGLFNVDTWGESDQDAAECIASISIDVSDSEFALYKNLLLRDDLSCEMKVEIGDLVALASDRDKDVNEMSIRYDWPPDGSGKILRTKTLSEGKRGVFTAPVKSTAISRDVCAVDEENFFERKIRKEEEKAARESAQDKGEEIPRELLSPANRMLREVSEARVSIQQLALMVRIICAALIAVATAIVLSRLS